jgi:hypothetical protein
MQFGLCNTPSTFQQMVDEILQEEKESGHVEVYIDNILVHIWDPESNQYWTGKVLAKLGENQLSVRKRSVSLKESLLSS